TETGFLKHYEIFILRWRSPMGFWRLVYQNLKYGYFWIFIVSVIALGWAFYSSEWKWGRLASLAMLVVAFGWEAITLRSHTRQFFKVPSRDESAELAAARKQVVAGPPE